MPAVLAAAFFAMPSFSSAEPVLPQAVSPSASSDTSAVVSTGDLSFSPPSSPRANGHTSSEQTDAVPSTPVVSGSGRSVAPARSDVTSAHAPSQQTLGDVRSSWADGFSFGSYGRVVVATDLRGHSGREANIVAHGTRIDEQTYAELEVHRDDRFGNVRTRVVATLGLTGPLFHQSGVWDVHMAVRNLYIEARGTFHPGLSLWVGSRMYRGDDVYLLNWWPLDNLNTVGGGARFDLGESLTFAAHVGTNRLDTLYQYQQIPVVPRDGFGSVQVVLLDRPRIIGSFKTTWWLMGRSARAGVKLSLYAEGHALPEGVRQHPDNSRRELLPADDGLVLGGQVGAYTGVRNTFVNLFFRYGQGLGAYGDLAVPFTLSALQTAARARDVVLALAGNWEWNMLGVLAGAYVRYFRDADAALYGRNDLVEGTFVLRPSVWLGEHFGLAVEGSYQAVQFNMLDPVTGIGPRSASLFRFGLIPYVTPAGRGNFTRPHLRVIYAVTLRDAGARRLYPPDDPFGSNDVEHFLGIGCEWWFNSSYL